MFTALGLILAVCIFASSTIIKRNTEDFAITSLAAYASKNCGIISENIYGNIYNESIELIVPDGVDYKKLTVTTEFNGHYVLPEDGIWIEKNNADRIVAYQNQTWELHYGEDNIKTYRIHVVSNTENFTEFKSFSFLKKDNPDLEYDYDCFINGNRITAYVPSSFNSFVLIPSFKTNGISVVCNNEIQKSGVTSNDFSNHHIYTVYGKNGRSAEYIVEVIPVNNGLKTLNINCADKISHDQKVNSTISLTENDNVIVSETSKIRVRGNYTALLIKKGYKITFDHAVKISEKLIPSKNLVLLANYFDTSMLRHAIAFDLWKNVMNIGGFTSNYEYVNVFLNGKFIGTYMMTDQVEILEDKIELGNVEIGSSTLPGFAFLVLTTNEKGAFITKKGLILKLLNFDELTDDERTKIYGVIQSAEDSFIDGSFINNRYIDLESFVNWFIINNISRNTDAFSMASTYMYWSKDNKLTVGPIWDFDLGFGNANTDTYEGLVAVNNLWLSQMLENDTFNSMIKSRWSVISPYIELESSKFIDSQYSCIKDALQQNYDVWNGCDDTDSNIIFLKDWIKNRVKWLNNEWGGKNE